MTLLGLFEQAHPQAVSEEQKAVREEYDNQLRQADIRPPFLSDAERAWWEMFEGCVEF